MVENILQFLILVVTFVLAICHPVQSFVFHSSSTEHHTTPLSEKENKLDVDLITRLKVIHPEQDYTDSIQRLDSLRSSQPDCFEVATVLIGSCESIRVKSGKSGSTAKNVAVDLETLKNLYAARLAICELLGVGASVPAQCTNIFDDNEVTTREHFKHHCYQSRLKRAEDTKLDFSKVRPCFKALEARQQSWTSFSNNKQNAELWCRLGRDAIEKNEVLEISKSAVNIMGDASLKLSESLQHSAKGLADLKGFTGTANAQLSQLIENLQASNDTLNSLVENFMQRLQFALSDALSSVQKVSSDAHDLHKDIADSGIAIHDSLQKVSEDVIGGFAEAAASQYDALADNNQLVVKVKQDLQSIHVDSVRMILTALEEVYLQSYSVQETFISMRTVQNELSQYAREVALSLDDTATRFEDLRVSQMGYAANQSLFHRELQYQQQVVLALQKENSILAANNLAESAQLSKLIRGVGWFFQIIFQFAIPFLYWIVWSLVMMLLQGFRVIHLTTAIALIGIPFISLTIAATPPSSFLPPFNPGPLLDRKIYNYWNPSSILKWIILVVGVSVIAIWRFSSYRELRRGPPYHHYKDILSYSYDGKVDDDQFPVTDFACLATPTTYQYPAQYRIVQR